MIRAKYLLVTAALVIASVTSAGCVEDQSLVIIHNQAPNENCVGTPSTSEPFLSHGTAFVGPGGGYVLTPLLQSNLTARAGNPSGGVIELTSAAVSIEPVDSDASRAVVASLAELRGLTRYFQASISPGGLTSLSIVAIDDSQSRALATAMQVGQTVEVFVRVVVYGESGGGSSVSSRPFLYPVTLVNAGAPGGLIDLGPCDQIPKGETGEVKGCFLNGQDGGSIECCTDAGGNPVCPAEGSMVAP